MTKQRQRARQRQRAAIEEAGRAWQARWNVLPQERQKLITAANTVAYRNHTAIEKVWGVVAQYEKIVEYDRNMAIVSREPAAKEKLTELNKRAWAYWRGRLFGAEEVLRAARKAAKEVAGALYWAKDGSNRADNLAVIAQARAECGLSNIEKAEAIVLAEKCRAYLRYLDFSPQQLIYRGCLSQIFGGTGAKEFFAAFEIVSNARVAYLTADHLAFSVKLLRNDLEVGAGEAAANAAYEAAKEDAKRETIKLRSEIRAALSPLTKAEVWLCDDTARRYYEGE